jgi:hypothetical protein
MAPETSSWTRLARKPLRSSLKDGSPVIAPWEKMQSFGLMSMVFGLLIRGSMFTRGATFATRNSSQPLIRPLSTMLFIVGISVLTLGALQHGHQIVRRRGLTVYVLMFSGGMLSLVRSADRTETIASIAGWGALLMVRPSHRLAVSLRRFWLAVWWSIPASLLLGLFWSYARLGNGQLRGVYANQNMLALAAVLSAAARLEGTLRARSAAITIFVPFIACYRADARTAMLTCLILAFFHFGGRGRGAITVCVCALMSIFGIELWRSITGSNIDGIGHLYDAFFGARGVLIDATLSISGRNLFTGVGLGASRVEVGFSGLLPLLEVGVVGGVAALVGYADLTRNSWLAGKFRPVRLAAVVLSLTEAWLFSIGGPLTFATWLTVEYLVLSSPLADNPCPARRPLGLLR